MSFTCLIVDDEPLARKVIELHLGSYPQFSLKGSCKNALEAFELINTHKIDLLFLDIHLPGVNGMQLIRSLKQPPAVVFTTAYSEYAAESYELEAIDYLVKPVTAEKLSRSLQKFMKLQSKPTQGEAEKEFLFLRVDGKLVKVFFKDIHYIESRKDYLMIHTSAGMLMPHMTMKGIAELLPAALFRRVHRSFIVASDRVLKVSSAGIELEKKHIPLGEKYRKEVLDFFSDRQ
ncbi:MAG TPA: response regulator transcription factor [Flavisolibacter sp.]|nr:response regulator transcription factor [Flavisolibacter sp.]